MKLFSPMFPTALILLSVCLSGCGEDVAALVVGDYVGSITTDSVVEDGGVAVTLGRVDNDTIVVSGDDFSSFEIDVMGVASVVTSVEDSPHEFSWTSGTMSFNRNGDEPVQFSGDAVASAETPLPSAATEEPATEEPATEEPATEEPATEEPATEEPGTEVPASLGATVEGTYTGLISGPVNDTTYTLTLTPGAGDRVSVSGPGIQTFEVPLVEANGQIEAEGLWDEGSFVYDLGDLDLAHTLQGMSFTGSAD